MTSSTSSFLLSIDFYQFKFRMKFVEAENGKKFFWQFNFLRIFHPANKLNQLQSIKNEI